MKILITGPPRIGKSRLLRAIVDESGRNAAGILTPEIRREGRREGFQIVDLASGRREIMAAPGIRGPKVSRYGVDVAAIDRTVERFWAGFPAADFIALDEIGPMEFFSPKFKDMVARVLESDKTVFAVVHRRFEAEFVKFLKPFHLDSGNFQELKQALLARLAAV